jgi:hypothetical protein
VSRHTSYKVELKDTLIRNTQRWFPTPEFSATALAGHIVMSALFFGAEKVEVQRADSWWGVFADLNWFEASEVPLKELLSRIFPFPGQVNSMRPETWLVAYSDLAASTGDIVPNAPSEFQRELETCQGWLVYRLLPSPRSVEAP